MSVRADLLPGPARPSLTPLALNAVHIYHQISLWTGARLKGDFKGNATLHLLVKTKFIIVTTASHEKGGHKIESW